jgi:sugar lactone lactonase YvrE
MLPYHIRNLLIIAIAAPLLAKGVNADQRTDSGATTIPASGQPAAASARGARSAPFQFSEIRFTDLAPADIELKQCWNALGMDDQGRVYVGISSLRNDGREDVAVFRYDPKQQERRFLGTLIEVARMANNLLPGESIPKGHTRIIFADGKMFLASQGFHDFKKDIDDLPKYRGSHIFVYDISTEKWQDLAAALPNGVVVEHQGIVALNIIRSQRLLIGLLHPHSDIILIDYRKNRIRDTISGIPWKLGNPLSREIVIAKNGDIYTYRGTEHPSRRKQVNPVWVYDQKTKSMKKTRFKMTNGFWIGLAESRDGRRVHVSTVNGQLYEFETVTGIFHDLGYMLPADDYDAGRRIRYQYGITLSPDERKIFFVHSGMANPKGRGELYSYDLGTGKVAYHQRLPPGIYTMGDIRDRENIYFCGFGTSQDVWSGDVRLIVMRVAGT